MDQLREDYFKMEARRNSAELYLKTEREKNKEFMATIKILREEKEALVALLCHIQQKYGVGANTQISEVIDDSRVSTC